MIGAIVLFYVETSIIFRHLQLYAQNSYVAKENAGLGQYAALSMQDLWPSINHGQLGFTFKHNVVTRYVAHIDRWFWLYAQQDDISLVKCGLIMISICQIMLPFGFIFHMACRLMIWALLLTDYCISIIPIYSMTYLGK